MRDEHEGCARPPPRYALKQLHGFLVGERARRLVQKDDRLDRVDPAQRESLCDLDELTLSERQRPREGARIHVDMQVVQHRFRLGNHRALAQPPRARDELVFPAKKDVLVHGDCGDQSLLLEDRRNPMLRRLGRMTEADWMSVNGERSRIRTDRTVDDGEQSRFSRAVLANQAEYGMAPQTEADLIERLDPGIGLRDVLKDDRLRSVRFGRIDLRRHQRPQRNGPDLYRSA